VKSFSCFYSLLLKYTEYGNIFYYFRVFNWLKFKTTNLIFLDFITMCFEPTPFIKILYYLLIYYKIKRSFYCAESRRFMEKYSCGNYVIVTTKFCLYNKIIALVFKIPPVFIRCIIINAIINIDCYFWSLIRV